MERLNIRKMSKIFYRLGKSLHNFSSRVRMHFIKGAFLSYGKKINIDREVTFEHPNKIIIDDGVSICKGVLIDAKTDQEFGVHLCKNSRIREGTKIHAYGGSIYIGENVRIGPNCVIYGQGGIKIGKNSGIAGLSFVVASNHTFDESDRSKPFRLQPELNKGINIGENVWGASNILILDGVTIGNDVTIGAGSVIRKDVPDGAVVIGNPAQICYIRKQKENL